MTISSRLTGQRVVLKAGPILHLQACVLEAGPRLPRRCSPLMARFHYLAPPPERFEILDRQLDNESAFAAAPPIAFDAAGQPLATTVNFDKPFPATVAL